jgi:hypothetical protein
VPCFRLQLDFQTTNNLLAAHDGLHDGIQQNIAVGSGDCADQVECFKSNRGCCAHRTVKNLDRNSDSLGNPNDHETFSTDFCDSTEALNGSGVCSIITVNSPWIFRKSANECRCQGVARQCDPSDSPGKPVQADLVQWGAAAVGGRKGNALASPLLNGLDDESLQWVCGIEVAIEIKP